MNDFQLYFGIGMEHILDTNGYDHILFIIGLCAIYQIGDWRNVVILVTAFTLGHSLTLALAVYEVIEVNATVIEFLIPVTILITAISNLFVREIGLEGRRMHINYAFALFFGLIHGFGFSNMLRAMLMEGNELVVPLLGFNIGLEVGQVLIVVLFLVVSFIFVDLVGVRSRDWKITISAMVAGASLVLIEQSELLNR